MVEIGTRLKELRQAKEMSQKQLADHLHVTPQTVSKWELNKSYPDLDTLLQLSDFSRSQQISCWEIPSRHFFTRSFQKKEKIP